MGIGDRTAGRGRRGVSRGGSLRAARSRNGHRSRLRRIEGALRQANEELQVANEELQVANEELDTTATELRESEQQLRALYEQTPAIVVLSHFENGRYVEVNQAFERIVGWSREEVVGRTSVEIGVLGTPEERERYAGLVREKGSVRDLEMTLHTRDGRTLTALMSGSVIEVGGERYLVSVAVDITARKRMEAELREREREYLALAENAPEVIARFDRQLRHTYINRYGARVYGVPKEEVIGKTSADLGMPPEKVAFWKEHFEQVLATGEQQTAEFDFDSPNLGHQFFSSIFVPERDERGEVTSILAITRDVTAMREALDALADAVTEAERSRAQLEAVFQAVSDGIVVTDMAGSFILVNEAEARITGYPSPEAMKRDLAYFARVFELTEMDGRQLPVEQWPVSKVLRGESVVNRELRGRRKDTGQEWVFSYSGEPVRDERGEQILALIITRDITERARAEEALRRYELIAEHSRDVILFMRRADGRILEANAAAAQAYGLTRDGLLGLTVQDLRAPGTQALTVDQMAEADARGILFETVHRRRDGSTFPVEVSSRGATVDGTRVLVSVVRDITERKHAEEALRESEERFRQLASAMPQLVWTARPDGTVDYYNDRVREFCGFSQGADGHWEWAPVLHPDDVQATVEAWANAVRTGSVYQIAHRVQRADGTYRWYLSRGVPARDEQGRIVRWYGTATDIDDQKRAEEQARFLGEASAILGSSLGYEETLRRVAELAVPALADWCVFDVVGENGEIRRVASAHRNTVHAELLDRLERYAPTPDSPQPAARAIRTGETVFVPDLQAALAASAQDEEHAPVVGDLGVRAVISAPVVARGRVLGAISLAYAESGRRPGPEDRAMAEELGRRAGFAIDNARLFESEQRARAEAQEANQAKDQFVAMVSHELRNPLNAITAGVDLLRRSVPLEGRVGRAIDIVGRNAELQARLVNDLLDLSRLSRGKLQLQRAPVELKRVVDAAVQAYEAEAKEAGLTLTCDSEPGLWVDGDFDRLQQVVMNLIGNALKFTPGGGSVRVGVWECGSVGVAGGTGDDRAPGTGEPGGAAASEPSGLRTPTHPHIHTPTPGRACIVVEDTGVGIDQETLGQLFTMFQQGGVAAQRKAGLGIGLALVKGIVERHGGRIWAESEGPGKGSRFTVELPLREAPSLFPSPRLPASPSQTRILIVEDNADARAMIADSLTLLGYSVREAGSGEEALDILREGAAAPEWRPDVILCDIGLPGMDGYEFLRRAHELPGMEGVPAFAITGLGQEEDVRRGREVGFVGHFVKPVDLRALEQRIREWLQGGS